METASGPAPRGQGLEFWNCPTVLVEGNVLAHKPDKINGLEALSYNPQMHNSWKVPTHGEIRNNVVYDWSGAAFKLESSPDELSVHDNFFQQQRDQLIILNAWKPIYAFRDNHYASAGAKLFQIAKQDLNWKQWLSQTQDHSDMAETKFADPSRDIVTYAKSIGLNDASLEGFLAAAREQRRGHWDPRLTADAVNDYIRAGFAQKQN